MRGTEIQPGPWGSLRDRGADATLEELKSGQKILIGEQAPLGPKTKTT